MLVGATMAALGAALESPAEVTVIERSAAPAPEFAGAFYPGECRGNEGTCPDKCADLRRELTERNVLADGRYHVPALVPVLFRRIKEAELHCLFWTDIVDIKPSANGDGYAVSFFNASGLQCGEFKRIVDTTAVPRGWEAPRRWSEKRIWAILQGSAPAEAEDVEREGILFRPGRFESESYFGVELKAEDDWPVARRILIDAWRSRPPQLADTRIASIATEFQYCSPAEPAEVGPGLTHLPSAGFPDPLEAFGAGCRIVF